MNAQSPVGLSETSAPPRPPRTRQAARLALRDATSAWHDRVDATFARADLGNRAGYAAFLAAQSRAHLPVEAALEAAGIADVVSDWSARRRGDALLADLADLDTSPPPPLAAPDLDGVPRMLGALYVLEGSRLGGAMLVRGVPEPLPRAFLSAGDSAAWRGLIALLDERLTDDAALDAATAAAGEVFALFEASGRAAFPDGPPLGR